MVDYMLMEAVALKVRKADAAEARKAEIADWKEKEKERLKKEFGG